jgi:hypothetical protein
VEIELAGVRVDLATREDLAGALARVNIKPQPLALSVAKVTPGAAFLYTFLDLGGPKTPGTYWNVLTYGAFGPDPFTPVAGQMFPFVAAVPPADSAVEPTFSNVVDIAVNLNNQAQWSGHQLLLHWGDHLILCFKGLPNNQQIIGYLRGEAYPAAAYPHEDTA